MKPVLTENQQLSVVDYFKAGENTSDISKKLGVNRQVVYGVLKRNGIKPCGKTGVRSRADHQKMVEDYESGLSVHEVASKHQMSYTRTHKILTKYIPEFRHKRNGRTTFRGYIYVKIYPDDPYYSMANSINYVFEHRLVMARSLGRPLEKHESVHHVNGDTSDNRIENLQLRYGKHGKGVLLRCRCCGSTDIETLDIK